MTISPHFMLRRLKIKGFARRAVSSAHATLTARPLILSRLRKCCREMVISQVFIVSFNADEPHRELAAVQKHLRLRSNCFFFGLILSRAPGAEKLTCAMILVDFRVGFIDGFSRPNDIAQQKNMRLELEWRAHQSSG